MSSGWDRLLILSALGLATALLVLNGVRGFEQAQRIVYIAALITAVGSVDGFLGMTRTEPDREQHRRQAAWARVLTITALGGLAASLVLTTWLVASQISANVTLAWLAAGAIGLLAGVTWYRQ